MHTLFPLFRSHLDLAHQYWTKLLLPNDIVIDATCGNGHDTLKLCQLIEGGTIYAFDIQENAVRNTEQLLKKSISAEQLFSVKLETRSHATFPTAVITGSVKLIVYNLGYLPGGDKTFTTMTSSTLESLKVALGLVCVSGAISITCYPGHSEGSVEQDAILDFIATLSPKEWNCCVHSFVNRKASPRLLLLQKSATPQ